MLYFIIIIVSYTLYFCTLYYENDCLPIAMFIIFTNGNQLGLFDYTEYYNHLKFGETVISEF